MERLNWLPVSRLLSGFWPDLRLSFPRFHRYRRHEASDVMVCADVADPLHHQRDFELTGQVSQVLAPPAVMIGLFVLSFWFALDTSRIMK